MGLDQYVTVREKGEELHYWRKHNALQGWMQRLWESRGGTGDFNCVDVYLYEDDLNKLEADIKAQQLPETSGFFYGPDSRFEEDRIKGDLEFIEKARKALANDKDVIYSSWW